MRRPPTAPKSLFITVRVQSGRDFIFDAWESEERARWWVKQKPLISTGTAVRYVGEYVKKR